MNNCKKVALIGIGGMGYVHYNCYKKIDNAKVIAVADVRTDMAKEKANNPDVNIYQSIDELLNNENPDMVDICTPSYMHKDMVIKCLRKGIHVLCEKPMSLTQADTKEISEEIKKSGKIFMTAHVVRFMPPYVYLKSIIESKELGNLVRLDMKRLSEIPTWSWDDWMTDTQKSGGTPLDLSIHDLDFIQYVFGKPKHINAVYHKLKNNNDYVISDLVYDTFAVSAEAAWYNYKIPFSAAFRAVFQDGIIEYKDNKVYKNGVETEIGAIKEDVSDSGINIKEADGYKGEIEYFIDCINNNRQPEIVTPDSSSASVALAEEIINKAILV